MENNKFQKECQPSCRYWRRIRCCGFCDSWRHCSNCHSICNPCLLCPPPCPPEPPAATFTALLRKFEVAPEGNVTTTPVPGAVFTLYLVADNIWKEVGRFTTSATGEIIVSGLARGDYVFVEVFPGVYWEPFNGITEYFFTVNNDSVVEGVVTVMAYNRRKSV